MSSSERLNIEIYETKKRIFGRDGWKCRNCNGSILRYPQMAHGISNSTANKRKYGVVVVHHDENLFSACSEKCNKALAIGKMREANHAAYIQGIIAGEEN